jgi:lipopolysaccharide export system protein LptA
MQRFGFFVALAILTAASAAAAQGPATPSPLGLGQGENKDAPVQIEAGTLEVHDKTKTATFSGNVQVVQGDTTMKCHSLVVFYGQEIGVGGADGDVTATTPAKSNLGMPKGAQNIRRTKRTAGSPS